MATIYIENLPYHVADGQNLLQACLALGFNLPYFCWHPALGSVGACRQCAVKQYKDEHDTRGRLVMACLTPAADGVRISIEDPEAHEFRAGVIEWLMINHPHDCPVCDEGGECHLQDMTVMTGHTSREYAFPKRTFRNQDLGPFVAHEMNRCIHCYRCVRYYRDYAGGRDFGAQAWHDRVYFGRSQDGALENEFSGNLVEICPTGVFTDKTEKTNFTRMWDLGTAPSICIHCGVGCNTIPGERYGTLRRIRNRYHADINSYFLCDRGRFGYEYLRDPRRITQPLARADRTVALEAADWDDALARAADALKGGGRAIGIGSPRASLEANFALRALVGEGNFFAGMPEREWRLAGLILRILQGGPARSASLGDVRAADAALVLGEDVTNTAPLLALTLRQQRYARAKESIRALRIPEWQDGAVREILPLGGDSLYLATPAATKLDDAGRRVLTAVPDDLARFGLAVAAAIDPAAPQPAGIPPEWAEEIRRTADLLRGAKRPVIVSGTGCGSENLIRAAANVAWALRRTGVEADLSLVLPEANSLGLALMGGGGIQSALDLLKTGTAETAVILASDLYRVADRETVEQALKSSRHVILLDTLMFATGFRADVVLPAAAAVEESGSLVNFEGRVQRYYQVIPPEGRDRTGWRLIQDLAVASGRIAASRWENLDSIQAAIAGAMPSLAPLVEAAPPGTFRMGGQRIPRQTPRSSGRTAIRAAVSVHDEPPPADGDTPFAYSMDGEERRPPPALIPHYWAPGWNSVQSVNKFQAEIGGGLAGGDPGRRLLEPQPGAAPDYFTEVPPAFAARDGRCLFLPLSHIFGSEPLSMSSPGIGSLAPKPYAAVNSADAARAGVTEGDRATVEVGGRTWDVFIRVRADIPAGAAGLPAGLPGAAFFDLPEWGTWKKS